MSSLKPKPLSPLPRSSIVNGYRIERCSGSHGSVPLSLPLHADKSTEQNIQKARPYPLTLNNSGEERMITQMGTLGETVHVLGDVVKALSATFSDVRKVHGDISPNTIFRNKDGQGILVDWDHNNWLRDMLRTYGREKFYGQTRRRTNY